MLKKENILHWIFLITLGSLYYFHTIEAENLYKYFSTQIPLDHLLRRWAAVLFFGLFFAFYLSIFIDIFHSIYLWWGRKNFIKHLDERWKLVTEPGDGYWSFYIDLESYKSGLPLQAWLQIIMRGSADFHFFRERKILIFKKLVEVDCNNGVMRTLRLITFKGYGGAPDWDSAWGKDYYEDSKFTQPVPESVWETVIRAVCEENKKRGFDFANEITPPQEIN